jgi:hypothetical protein
MEGHYIDPEGGDPVVEGHRRRVPVRRGFLALGLSSLLESPLGLAEPAMAQPLGNYRGAGFWRHHALHSPPETAALLTLRLFVPIFSSLTQPNSEYIYAVLRHQCRHRYRTPKYGFLAQLSFDLLFLEHEGIICCFISPRRITKL